MEPSRASCLVDTFDADAATAAASTYSPPCCTETAEEDFRVDRVRTCLNTVTTGFADLR